MLVYCGLDADSLLHSRRLGWKLLSHLLAVVESIHVLGLLLLVSFAILCSFTVAIVDSANGAFDTLTVQFFDAISPAAIIQLPVVQHHQFLILF